MVNISIISTSFQLVHCYVQKKNDTMGFLFTVVYGVHTIADRKDMWMDIERIAQNIQLPWLVMGDFKVMLNHDDRLGSQIHDGEVEDFANLLTNTSLDMLQ